MTSETFARLKVMAGATFAIGLIVGMPITATADVSYPWCAQGGTLHCYYSTREQCEQTEDYRGFCVANPEAQTQTNRIGRSLRHVSRSGVSPKPKRLV